MDSKVFAMRIARQLAECEQGVDRLMAETATLLAELATAPATVEQLLALKPGDFIELDLETMIKAKIDGVPIYDCHYGTSNGKYALKIDRLLTTPNMGWLGDSHEQ